jgi:signal transduction histidine kinase
MAKRFAISDNTFMDIVGYVTLAAVALLGINLLPPGLPRSFALALLIVFAIFYSLSPQADGQSWRLHAYFIIQMLIGCVLMSIYSEWGVFPMLFFILSAQAMSLFPERTGFLWVGILTFATGLVFFLTGEPRSAFLTLLPYAAGYWFFAAFARSMANAQEARAESQRLLSELQIAHRQLQDYAERVEELAVSEERNRLAREMHDTLGHRLTVAAVQLEGAQRLIPAEPERATEMVATVREQVREALGELRNTVATLREPLQTDLSLWNALPRLVAPFDAATGLDVALVLPPEEITLPTAHRLTVYRAVQEALTNVQRHAQAEHVWIELSCQESALHLRVSDDGVGVSEQVEENRFGLRGLRERVAQLGGKLDFSNREAGGAQLNLVLPLAHDRLETIP